MRFYQPIDTHGALSHTSRRLASRLSRGETIIETLVSLLIIVVSFVGLATATVSSFRITNAASKRDAAIRAQQNAAAVGAVSPNKDYLAAGTMTFSVGKDSYAVPVTYYGGADIASYARDNSGNHYPAIEPDTPPDDKPTTVGPIKDFSGDHVFTLTVKTTWEEYVRSHFQENDLNTHKGALRNTGAGTLIMINGELYVTTTLNYIGANSRQEDETIDYYLNLPNKDMSALTNQVNGGTGEPPLIKVKTNVVVDQTEEYIYHQDGQQWVWKPGVHVEVGSLVWYNGTLYVVYPGENTDTQGTSADNNNYWPAGQHVINGDQVTRTEAQ